LNHEGTPSSMDLQTAKHHLGNKKKNLSTKSVFVIIDSLENEYLEGVEGERPERLWSRRISEGTNGTHCQSPERRVRRTMRIKGRRKKGAWGVRGIEEIRSHLKKSRGRIAEVPNN